MSLPSVINATIGRRMAWWRSKGPTDSFPNQSSQKGKSTMGNNVEDIGLTDVVVAQPIIVDQNELIMQLMQQITEMRVEMQRRQDLPNPAFAFNSLADGRPPLHFPPSSAE
uniref:Integrase core domain containing protein n=1 Tax=Solanum tuberosum TaxID=4113 RepID=M1DCN6_SOLTU